MRRDTFLKTTGRAGRGGRLAPVGPRGRQRQDDDPRQSGRRLGHHRPRAGQGPDGGQGRRQRELRQQGRRRRCAGPGPVRQRQQGRPERTDGDGRRHAGRHHHRQAAGQPQPGDADRAPDQRIQRVRAAGQLAAQDHGRRGRATEEGPGQRQVGRRFARLHRAHRRGHDRARSGRRSGQDQLRGLPRGRRSHGGHPGRQRHGGRQRLQRVRRVHQHRQDEGHRRHLGARA